MCINVVGFNGGFMVRGDDHTMHMLMTSPDWRNAYFSTPKKGKKTIEKAISMSGDE